MARKLRVNPPYANTPISQSTSRLLVSQTPNHIKIEARTWQSTSGLMFWHAGFHSHGGSPKSSFESIWGYPHGYGHPPMAILPLRLCMFIISLVVKFIMTWLWGQGEAWWEVIAWWFGLGMGQTSTATLEIAVHSTNRGFRSALLHSSVIDLYTVASKKLT